MSVAIIGGRGSGKTVFVSLLATTAIEYSVTSKQHFRYYTSPEFVTLVHDVVASMKLQKWPGATLKGTLTEYRFWFGFSKKFAEVLSNLYDKVESLIPSISKFEKPSRREQFNIIEFSVYDIAGEDVDTVFRAAQIAKERGISAIDLIPENLKTILDCDVLVFLIDSSRVTTDKDDPKYKEMIEYDGLMASLMSLVAMYKSSKHGSYARGHRAKIYPVLVFTKFDTIEKKVLRAIGIPDDFNTWFLKESNNRKKINKTLVEFSRRFFAHTLAIIYGGTLLDVPLESAQVFASYVMTELSEDGIPVPMVVKNPDGVSYDLVYSRSEYVRFIDYFGSKSSDIKKSHKEPGTPITGIGR